MGKDYFSDIDTSEGHKRRTAGAASDTGEGGSGAEKSIRNITVSPRRSAMTQRASDVRAQQSGDEPRVRRARSKLLVWSVAVIAVLIVLVLAFVFLSARTTVEITPRTHQITLDPSTQFTAYPASGVAAAGIVYTVKSIDLDESTIVPASGSEKAEDRASGSITVYNAYAATPVRLIKNTRFESPQGLVYRIPASIEVPGKKGVTPGEITVTVFADQPGEQYNIGPTDKFTVPGLKNAPDMYNGVYARSSQPFTGGIIGLKPAVSLGALESARAEIRSRLTSKIQESVAGIAGAFAFADLARIEYESLPTIADPAGGAKVTERAHVSIPIFPTDNFAGSIAKAVSADAADQKVTLQPRGQFAAHTSGQTPEILGASPLTFTLSGGALVVWDVDVQAVKEALAGKDKDAFEQIVSTFLGIKDARANITPRWNKTFPENPDDIDVKVITPTEPNN